MNFRSLAIALSAVTTASYLTGCKKGSRTTQPASAADNEEIKSTGKDVPAEVTDPKIKAASQTV